MACEAGGCGNPNLIIWTGTSASVPQFGFWSQGSLKPVGNNHICITKVHRSKLQKSQRSSLGPTVVKIWRYAPPAEAGQLMGAQITSVDLSSSPSSFLECPTPPPVDTSGPHPDGSMRDFLSRAEGWQGAWPHHPGRPTVPRDWNSSLKPLVNAFQEPNK